MKSVTLTLAASMVLASFAVAQAPAKGDESLAHANGISIAYRTYGSSKDQPLLLVMGTGGQLTQWPPELIAELVQRGYYVIVYDNRDVGHSTRFAEAGRPDWGALFRALKERQTPPVPYTLHDMALDAVGILDALGIERAHVAGISMGGMIAQILATSHPGRVRSLTSIAAGAGNPAVPIPGKPEVLANVPPARPAGDYAGILARELALWRAIGSPAYPEDETTLRTRLEAAIRRSYDPEGLERQGAAAVAAGDRRESLRSVRAPTVVLHGAADPLVPVDAARDVAASIPGAELRIVPGMGHDLPVALVSVVADAITAAAARSRTAL